MDRPQAMDTDHTTQTAASADLEGLGQWSQNMESLGFMASQIAHDLNNTLIGITGYAELAVQGAEDANLQKRYLEQVLKASQRASNLVQQILKFGRVAEPDFQPVNLEALVHESLDFLTVSLPSNIEVVRQITVVHPMVMADAVQLHQVLMNLVVNASQAMSPLGGLLEVKLADVRKPDSDLPATCNLEAGPFVVLSVRDHGSGMSREIQETVFKPFYTTKGTDQGCGLGLCVVQRIVRRHGGAVTVQSGEGWGTKLQVFLPSQTD